MSLLMNSFQAVEKARGARQNNLVEQLTPMGEEQETPATAPPAPEAKSSANLLGTARCLTLSPLPPVAITSHGMLAQRILKAG
ncbi:MAG: hypothetical protein HQL55_07290, partial [Magnetococcales bacterium]|nr:hypothetical protein [Magnetococcales bacterium]